MPAAPDEFHFICPLCDDAVYLRIEHVGVEVPCPHCGEHWTASPAAVIKDPVLRAELFGDSWVPPPEARRDWRGLPPSRDDPDAPPEIAPPVSFDCPRCKRSMELREEHEGHQVPCPFCGFQFTPDTTDVIPPPRPQTVRVGDKSVRATWAMVCGILGILAVPLTLACCVTFPLLACGPVGLLLVHKDRAEARATGRKDSGLESAWVLNLIATGILVLTIVGSGAVMLISLAAA